METRPTHKALALIFQRMREEELCHLINFETYWFYKKNKQMRRKMYDLSNSTYRFLQPAVATASWYLWGYSIATVTRVAVAEVYPQNTFKGTPTYSSHIGSVLYETYGVGQEEFVCVYEAYTLIL